MTAPTVPVTIRIADFGGPAVPGITVTAAMNMVDYTADGIFVGTEHVSGVTDVNGELVMNLFPNAVAPAGLGTVGSTARFTAKLPGSRRLDVRAAIPNAPCDLTDILVAEDIDLTEAQRVLQEIQSDMARAEAAAESVEYLYPGSFAVEPTTRPDGSPRQVGDTYFNSASNLGFRWNGSTWVSSDISTANLAAPGGSALVGFLQSGAGSVPQTAEAKLRERISVKNFGAVGDGVTDDAAAIQLAINAAATLKKALYLPGGTYKIGAGLTMPRRVSIYGDSRPETIIKASDAIRMLAWFGGGNFSGAVRDVTFDGNSVATEGVLVGGGADYRMDRVHIKSVAGVGLVLSTTQNSVFHQVQLESCTRNLLWTNGAWNNVFTRCEFATATQYHLHAFNDASYLALTGEVATDSKSARHNTMIGCIMEQGSPTSLIRLENTATENTFIALEMQGGSNGNPQVYLAAGSTNNVFTANTNFQRGSSLASFAVENHAFGTKLIDVVTTGWSGTNWITTDDYLFVSGINGDAGNNITADAVKNYVINRPLTIGGGRYWSVNEVLRVTQFGSNARPRVDIDGDCDPATAAARDLGKLNAWRDMYVGKWFVGGAAASPVIRSGAGSPENAVSAPIGSLYMRTDGGAGTCLYVKETGAGNTGWVGK